MCFRKLSSGPMLSEETINFTRSSSQGEKCYTRIFSVFRVNVHCKDKVSTSRTQHVLRYTLNTRKGFSNVFINSLFNYFYPLISILICLQFNAILFHITLAYNHSSRIQSFFNLPRISTPFLPFGCQSTIALGFCRLPFSWDGRDILIFLSCYFSMSHSSMCMSHYFSTCHSIVHLPRSSSPIIHQVSQLGKEKIS